MAPQRKPGATRDPRSTPLPSHTSQPSAANPSGPRHSIAAAHSFSHPTSASEMAMTPETGNMASSSRGSRASMNRGPSDMAATASTSSSTLLEIFESAEAASEGLLEACHAAGGLAIVKQAKTKWTIACGRTAGTCPWSAAAYKVLRGSGKPAGLPGRWWREVIHDTHSHADAAAPLPSPPAGSPDLELDAEPAALASPSRSNSPTDPLPPAFYPQLPPPPSSLARPAQQHGPRPSPATWPNTVRPRKGWRRWNGKQGKAGEGSKRTHDRARRRQRQADGEAVCAA